MKSRAKLAVTVAVFTMIVVGVGSGFDRVLIREGVARAGVLFLSNLLTGLVAGALFLQYKLRAEEKQRLLKDRLKKIADVNHHVRNALQVVAFYQYQTQDPEMARLVQESIQRIEWTLQEVLPRGWELDRNLYPARVPNGGGRRQGAANVTAPNEDL